MEIHHADLDAGYAAADWPLPTAAAFLDDAARRHRGPGIRLVPDDDDRRWALGSPVDGAPTVTGPLRMLAWWATGRDAGSVVSSSTGTMPSLEG